jgi:Uma2 family endonuclease
MDRGIKIMSQQIISQETVLLLDGQDDNFWVEVEDGVITFVERNFTWFEALLVQELFAYIKSFTKPQQIGTLMYDGARYILVGDKEAIYRAYIPDLSFIKKEHFPTNFDWNGDFFGAPDLAVEVISHGLTNKHIIRRLDRYFEAGTSEAWLIYPDKQVVHQYQVDRDMPLVYGIDDTLTSDLFPNLKIVLRDIFTPAP